MKRKLIKFIKENRNNWNKESQLLSKIDRLESALEKIKNGTHPFNEREAFIFVDVAKQIASDALLSLQNHPHKRNK